MPWNKTEMTVLSETVDRVLHPANYPKAPNIPKKKTLFETVDTVMTKPACDITGEQSEDVERCVIHTPVIDQKTKYKLTKNLEMRTSRKGLVELIEKIIAKADKTPLSGVSVLLRCRPPFG